MTIVSVSIHAKLDAGIRRLETLAEQLGDETDFVLDEKQIGDYQAMMSGIEKFQQEMISFPDFSTQTSQQLTVLRHDLRNHLNLIGGFAFVFASGLGGDLPEQKTQIASQMHQISKGLLIIVNKIA